MRLEHWQPQFTKLEAAFPPTNGFVVLTVCPSIPEIKNRKIMAGQAGNIVNEIVSRMVFNAPYLCFCTHF